MEGLHSLLHTVGFFFYFPFHVLSVLVMKPTDSTRKRERERKRETGRQRECARVRARGFWSTWYLCPPQHCPRARGVRRADVCA